MLAENDHYTDNGHMYATVRAHADTGVFSCLIVSSDIANSQQAQIQQEQQQQEQQQMWLAQHCLEMSGRGGRT
jgi:hypothetical protein